MLKSYESCLSCKHHLKHITMSWKKGVENDKTYVLTKVGLKLKSSMLNIVCKYIFLQQEKVAEKD